MARQGLGVLVLLGAASLSAPTVGVAQDTWVVESTPQVTIGLLDGPEEYMFTRVLDGAILSDGTIVVLQYLRDLFELRYYDQHGRHLVSVGRWGRGPFEFSSPVSGLGVLPGDSLMLMSHMRRYSVFGPRGERARSGRVEVDSRSQQGLMWDFLHGSNVALVSFLSDRPAVRGSEVEGEAKIEVLDLSDGRSTEVGRMSTGRAATSDDGVPLQQPFHPVPIVASGGGRVWWAMSDWDEVSVTASEGAATTKVRLRSERGDVTRAHRSRWKEYDLGRTPERFRASVERHHGRLEYPDELPRIHDIWIDRTGLLWALGYEVPWSTAPYRFDVHDASGALVARASVPTSVLGPRLRSTALATRFGTILEIGDDYILVRSSDDLGVTSVRRHALVKGN